MNTIDAVKKIRKTHNWDELKLSFLKSDYAEVKPFLDTRGVKYSGHTAEMVLGWADEKKEMFKSAFNKGLKEIEADTTITITELWRAKKLALQSLIRKLEGGRMVPFQKPNGEATEIWQSDLSPYEMRIIIETIKIELNEPVLITKGVNLSIELPKPPTDEEMEKMLNASN